MSFFFLVISVLQDLREKDGIPDLRRAARFRYASVTPLEVSLHHRYIVKNRWHAGLIVAFCCFVN